MASIFPETMMSNNGEKQSPTSGLTLETIIGKLFHFHTQAHLFHFQTPSYAEHKALDKLYKKLVDFKDEIGEQSMGYFKAKPKNLPVYPFINYSPQAVQSFLDEIQLFSKQLEEFGETSGYCNLSNLAEELSGLAASTRYLLTLS